MVARRDVKRRRLRWFAPIDRRIAEFLAAGRRRCRVVVRQSDDKRGVVQVIKSRSAT